MKTLLKQLIRHSGQSLIFPFYHLISDQAPAHTTHLFRARSPHTFERDIKTFLNFFDPISVKDLISLLKEPYNRKNKYFLISFDDGYREVYDIAAPILNKCDLPAIAFVNPTFIDNQHLFYRNKASLLVEACNHAIGNLAEDEFSHKKAQDTLRDILLSADHTQDQFLDQVAQWTYIDFAKCLNESKPYLSLGQLHELSQNGFTIGAHSMNHPDFSKLSVDLQLEQANQSIQWIQDNFRNQPKVFAFPYSDLGVSKTFFEQLYCDLSFGTGMIKKDVRTNHYQRLDMEKSDRTCHSILIREFVKYYLKMLVGRHKEGKNA